MHMIYVISNALGIWAP